MRLEVTWLNRNVEMLEGWFGPETRAEHRALTYLYNRLLGPVTRVNVLRPEIADLPIFTSSCRHVSMGDLFPDLVLKQAIADAVIIPGGGKGLTARAALTGGLGEIAERLLGVLHFAAVQDALELATFEELESRGCRALGPEDLPLFANEQYADPRFPYKRFTADAPLRWLTGIDLVANEPVAVPAQIVLLYYKHHPDEARIGYPTTGGLAFHPERQQALLHSLVEVVERDAINTRWYRRVPPRRVVVELAALGAEMGPGWPTRWSTPGIPEVEVYLNETDIPVPVFTALAVDRSRTRRAFLGGGGAGLSRARALAQSLFELGQTRTSLKYYRPIGLKEIRADSTVSEMTDFFDAAIYYGFSENIHRLDWYRRTTDYVHWNDIVDPPVDPEGGYATMLRWMREADLTPIAFDFGGASWPGAGVTKVLVPELTQACLPSHPYLGHPRFFDLPSAASRRTLAFDDLNADPVPFP